MDTIDKVINAIAVASNKFEKIILCGDINLDANKFQDSTYSHIKEADLLNNGLSEMGFGKNLTNQDTFYARSGLSSSRIDLVFSTTEQINVSVGKHLIADPLSIFISFSSKDRQNNKK